MEKVKTKVRFTSLDVAAITQNLQRLIGMRATNIYDLNPSTYIIKLAKSEDKTLLLIENGVRFHTVEEKADKKAIPSGFTMKFRKFLRSKRLEGVRQVGVERVVVLTFGTEAYANHLILELYSQGNIILTDNNYRILQCIRSHEFTDKVKTAVGQIYPFEYAAHIYMENIDITMPTIEATLDQMAARGEDDGIEVANKKKKKNNTKKQGLKMRDIIFKLIPCLYPAVIDNILIENSIDPEQAVSKQELKDVQQAAEKSYKYLKDFLKSEHKGYLYSKKELDEKPEEEKEYFEYSPYITIKYNEVYPMCKFETFDAAVREYYSKYKKSQHQQEQQFEQLAWKKYEQIKKDQDTRVKKLQDEQDIYKIKAEYIEKNVQDVDAIIKIVKTMEDNGYSWQAIQRMISDSKKNGDPLANMIYELNILKRQVTVLLGDPISEQQHCELLPVQINIDYNAYTNATMYYESKKKNYQKQKRTKQASEQVLKIAEKDALKVIEKKKNEQLYKNLPTRKQFWFEKFYWFISSEGVLVISGRDSHQNQLLVKRYMKPGDLYMHSDYGGAASTVIKTNSKQNGIPRTTLDEAAIFTVCRSKAWDTKILSGAWWVYHDQVSKSAPTGEFLPTGSFMIRGKRNFIQPNRMQMGITFLYRIDDQSAKRHMNDRRIHEEETRQENKQSIEQRQEIENSQEFAIISLETGVKTKGPKNQQKNQNKNIQPPSEVKKMESKKNMEQNQNSDEDDKSGSQSSSGDEQKQKYNNGRKNEEDKNKKKKDPQQNQNVPKQRMKNKRKLKKVEKYLEEQDEEEREMIMKMIGAREMKQYRKDDEEEVNPKLQKAKGKNKKKGLEKYIGTQNTAETDEKLNPDKVLFLKKKQDKEESSSSQISPEEANEKNQEEKGQVPENQQNQKPEEEEEVNEEDQAEKKEAELLAEKLAREKQLQEEVDEKQLNSEIAELFKLVGKVHPEDRFEFLVTMCAPYNSIKQNRFKIKLVPGGLKKGKAARNVMHYFSNTADLSEAEKPLLRNVPEQEVINALLGNVKLAGAGLLKMEQKEKAEKKERRKQTQRKQRNG